MTSGGAGVGGAGVGEENIFKVFRLLVLSEDASRLDLITSELLRFGYSVSRSITCGSALEMVMKHNAFHAILIDDSVKGVTLEKLFRVIKLEANNVCIINPSPGSVAELMNVTKMSTRTVGNYMRRTRESRAGATGAGPSVAQPPMQPSYLEQLAQVEAGTSVVQPSSVFGTEITEEGDVSFSDLDFFQNFTQL